MATFPPTELQYQLDHKDDDRSHQLAAFFIVCMVLSAFFVAVRLASRKMMKLGVQVDDYTILAGLILAEGSFIVLLIYAFAAGLGRHWVTLTPDQKILFSKLNYAYNILNVSCYPVIKISILLLYRRLFNNHRFQRFVWFGIAFLALLLLSTFLATVFSCTPVRGFWDPTVQARCINSVTFYWSYTIANVVTDFYLLLVPIPMLWSLKISTKQKIGVSLLFTLGCLTCIISIIRIVYYLRFNPYDPSYSFIGDAYSTPAEVCLAIICACFPTVRPLFRQISAATHSRLNHSSYSLASTRPLKQRQEHIEQSAGVSIQRPSGEPSEAWSHEESTVWNDGRKGVV